MTDDTGIHHFKDLDDMNNWLTVEKEFRADIGGMKDKDDYDQSIIEDETAEITIIYCGSEYHFGSQDNALNWMIYQEKQPLPPETIQAIAEQQNIKIKIKGP